MNVQAAAVEAEPDEGLAVPDEGVGTPEDPVLNDRYKIIRGAPLAAYGTLVAQAYRVEDLEGDALDLYALVGDQNLPPRREEIAILLGVEHRHLMRLVDAGTVPLSAPGNANHTVILEFPRGGHVMPPKGAQPMSEQDVKRRVMEPLLEALSALHELSITHCAVHPHNLFYADELGRRLVLGEGVSSVPGQCQSSAFEPIERACVPPLGRGIGGCDTDVHAFGATILALLMGCMPGADIATSDLVDARMEHGSLRALMGEFRCSRGMGRLLAGMMADSPGDRWTLAEVEQWLLGEHVSGMLVPRLINPVRPFPFADRQFQNTRAIAAAFNSHWSDAAAEIQTGRLEKWLASSRERLVMAESVAMLSDNWAGGNGKMSTDEMIFRTCILLDIDGPIRYKGLSVSIAGIGPLLAEAYIEGRDEQAQKIGAMIGSGLPLVWIGADNDRRKSLASTTAKFYRIRQYIKKSDLGYGLERCLYELNPTMRCLSPLIEPDACGEPVALLSALDRAGPESTESTPWTERHVAAFIAAVFHPQSDATLASTEMPDDAKSAQTLSGLVLFATAQGRSELPLLPRLSRAMGPAVLELAVTYRSQTTRGRMIASLDRLLGEGDLSAIVKKLTDTELRARDHQAYLSAVSSYNSTKAEIAVLESNVARRRLRATLIGRRIAAWVAFIGLAAITATLLTGLTP